MSAASLRGQLHRLLADVRERTGWPGLGVAVSGRGERSHAAAGTRGHRGAETATAIGGLAFLVFAVASLAQVVVGLMLDRFGPRRVFMGAAALQVGFFAVMPGLTDTLAFLAALGFMLGAFGQIPINDFMIGKMASGPFRARIYGVRYVASFTALAATLPLIAFVYDNWGFDALFRILALAAMVVFTAVACLPRRLPTPEPAPA
jgi:MFS family permease